MRKPVVRPPLPHDAYKRMRGRGARAALIAECKRQSLLLRDDPHEREIMDFMESIADTRDWEA
jgi:hypothetical protein